MSGGKPKLPAVPKPSGYEVGFGKPPTQTRFKPGTSGNPRGRPKGAKNKRPALNEERLKAFILDEAYREITVRDGDKNVSVPMAQAVVRALAVNAAKGQHRSQRLFAEILSATERQNKALADEWLNTVIEYKVEWDQELERREKLGITNLSAPLPHPDQVRIDMNTGEARIQGPMTKEDRAQLELWQERRTCWADELQMALEELKTETDKGLRKIFEADALRARKLLVAIDNLLEKIGY